MEDPPTRVLLVEDNPGDARLLSEALAEVRFLAFEITHVGRLSEALRRLGEARFDVILLDLSLPDSPGLGTLMKVQAKAPRVPVVVLTGIDDQRLAQWAIEEGAEVYLVKDQLDADSLVAALRSAIESHRTVTQRVDKRLSVLGMTGPNEE